MVDCPKCAKQVSTVKLSGGTFCSTCGSRLSAATKHIDLGGKGKSSTVTRPSAVVAARPGQLLQDVGSGKAASSPTQAPIRTNALTSGRMKPAKGGVLDLRAAAPHHPKKDVNDQAMVEVVAPQLPHHPVDAPAEQTAKVAPAGRAVKHAERAAKAQTVDKSPQVSRFGSSPSSEAAVAAPAPAPEPETTRELPAHVATHHEAMQRLVEPSTQPSDKTPLTASLRALPLTRVATVAAAIVIMGGYIWLQNYPKMAVQSAASKAGFAASLPGYVPSSYSLSGPIQANAGIITLNFTSPTAPAPLTITQHRTSWDSSSLLDNYVATKSSDYTAIQGQGLTIYLYGKNQAAWVNHGVWYAIEGASRLSREQILKIAYSL